MVEINDRLVSQFRSQQDGALLEEEIISCINPEDLVR